jgi:carboxypeptidase T
MTRLLMLTAMLVSFSVQASADEALHWIKAKAKNKIERTKISAIGASIEAVTDDYVVALGTTHELEQIKKLGLLETSFQYPKKWDFPKKDEKFHNYQETIDAMKSYQRSASEIVSYEIIGKSREGKEIPALRISTGLSTSSNKPGILFVGTHHAREHVSTEVPLMLAEHLVSEYQKGNKDIIKLLEGREVHIVPMLNPDGVEYDIVSGSYAGWRKNRVKNKDGTYGVDLNRNYGFKWGQTGASGEPNSETYYGSEPFSEPETQAVKKFIETHENINVMLSFHTYSELILYPWGHTYESIADQKDLKVFETMATKMATYNNYKPQPSSDLYLVSGEATDWAYGEHKIFGFTFELDPKFAFGIGGFYPGQEKIPGIFAKNLPACLYLIEYADNPYRVLNKADGTGLSTPLVR